MSFDPPEKNLGFAQKNEFPFTLLSDLDHSVGARYETVRAPDEAGSDNAKRRTYLIDPEGRIAKAYRVTDIPAHPRQVLEDLRAMRNV